MIIFCSIESDISYRVNTAWFYTGKNNSIRSTNRKIIEISFSGIRLADSCLEPVEIRFEIRRLIDGTLCGLRICRNLRTK